MAVFILRGNQWDATRCNSGESALEKTTSVHASPQGASPYGVLDMAGNVWEWTRSLDRSWEKTNYRYPYKSTDGRENLAAGDRLTRVLRGGAFANDRWRVRYAFRFIFLPVDRGALIGFRVVVRPAS